MNLAFNFGNSALVIPGIAQSAAVGASAEALRALLALAGDISLASNAESLGEHAGITRAAAESAVEYWISAGVLVDTGGENASEKKAASAVTAKRSTIKMPDALPKYSTRELGDLLERRKEYKDLIDGCQQVFKKIFNTTEINIIVGMSDYLGLANDYILLLFAHCEKMEHKSVRTVEKLAIKLHDEGVTEAIPLAERLRSMEELASAEADIRRIFGITSRAFTTKEKKLVTKWISEYKYSFDIISRAYEMTVDSTQKPSIPYAAAIIDRWYTEGIRTVEEIDSNIESHKKKKADDSTSSFDTDDFFAAAIKRGKEKAEGGAK